MAVSRNVHWRVSFSTREVEYYVDIYEDGFVGDVVHLKGGPEPFVVQEDDDEDAFLAVRPWSGYVNILAEDRGVVEELTADSGDTRFVQLRTAAGSVKWQGYMQAEQFSVDWDCAPLVVSFPVYSILETLRYIDYSPSHRLLPLGAIVKKALQNGGSNFEDYYTPDTWRGYDHPFCALVNDVIFGAADETEWRQYPGKDGEVVTSDERTSCLEVLEAVGRYCGWVLHEAGRDLVWVSVNDECGYLRGKVSAMNTVYPGPADGADVERATRRVVRTLPGNALVRVPLSLRGTDHVQSEVEGYRYVDVWTGLDAPRDPLETDLTPWDPVGGVTRRNPFLWYAYGNVPDRHLQYQYDLVGGSRYDVPANIWAGTTATGAGRGGGLLMRVLTGELLNGSFYLRQVTRDGFASALGIIHMPGSVKAGGTYMVAQYVSRYAVHGYTYVACGLSLTGTVSAYGMDWGERDALTSIRMQLKWMGKDGMAYYFYWNSDTDQGWSRNVSTFDVWVKDGVLYGGCYTTSRWNGVRAADRFFIPADGRLDGAVTLTVYGLEQRSGVYATLVKDLRLAANNGNDVVVGDGRMDISENHFKAKLGGVRRGVYELEGVLASRMHDSQVSDAIVLGRDGVSAWGGGPEVLLLSRLAGWYGRGVPQLRVRVVHDDGLMPFDLVEVGDDLYELVWREVDWRADEDVLVLQRRPTAGEDDGGGDADTGDDLLADGEGEELAATGV